MSNYAILDATRTTVVDVRDYSDAWYAEAVAAANPKVTFLRPLLVNAAPAITAAQKLLAGPYVIEPSQVRRTWTVVAKTAADLDQDARLAQMTVLANAIALFDAGTGSNAQVQRAIAFLLRQVQLRGSV